MRNSINPDREHELARMNCPKENYKGYTGCGAYHLIEDFNKNKKCGYCGTKLETGLELEERRKK